MAETGCYEILALKYGTHANRTRNENFLLADDHAAPAPLDYFVWIIRNDRRTILVDTGFDRAQASRRARTLTHEPREVLDLIGIDADTIDTVMISHLHYDHAGTLNHYPAARFHIQEAEIEARLDLAGTITGPLRDDRDPARVRHSYAEMARARMLMIAAGYEDCDDVDALRADPALKIAVGRCPKTGADLMSQPTHGQIAIVGAQQRSRSGDDRKPDRQVRCVD